MNYRSERLEINLSFSVEESSYLVVDRAVDDTHRETARFPIQDDALLPRHTPRCPCRPRTCALFTSHTSPSVARTPHTPPNPSVGFSSLQAVHSSQRVPPSAPEQAMSSSRLEVTSTVPAYSRSF